MKVVANLQRGKRGFAPIYLHRESAYGDCMMGVEKPSVEAWSSRLRFSSTSAQLESEVYQKDRFKATDNVLVEKSFPLIRNKGTVTSLSCGLRAKGSQFHNLVPWQVHSFKPAWCPIDMSKYLHSKLIKVPQVDC